MGGNLYEKVTGKQLAVIVVVCVAGVAGFLGVSSAIAATVNKPAVIASYTPIAPDAAELAEMKAAAETAIAEAQAAEAARVAAEVQAATDAAIAAQAAADAAAAAQAEAARAASEQQGSNESDETPPAEAPTGGGLPSGAVPPNVPGSDQPDSTACASSSLMWDGSRSVCS